MKDFIVIGIIMLLLSISQQAQCIEPSLNGAGSGVTINLNLNAQDSTLWQTISSMLQNISSEGAQNAQNTNSINNIKKQPSLINIESVYHYSFFKKRNNAMAVGFENYFKIANFKQLKNEYLDPNSDRNKLVFFANGKPFPSIKLFLFDESNGTISFMIDRGDTLTQKFVKSFISKFMYRINNPVVGFGYFDNTQKQWVEITNKEIEQIDILKPYTLTLVLIWFIFLFLFFYRLGKNTNLLKGDTSEDSSYSLSLTQFAFWTVIIFSSYFYLWIVNLELAVIPSSTLVLLGITAATTASSRAIDNGPKKENKKTTNHFFKDLLSDGNLGYSVHRCQLFLVTLMFGVFYIFEVVRQQTLPDFDNSLLWLIGISSGTFVGIKSVEGNLSQNTNPQITNASSDTGNPDTGNKTD